MGPLHVTFVITVNDSDRVDFDTPVTGNFDDNTTSSDVKSLLKTCLHTILKIIDDDDEDDEDTFNLQTPQTPFHSGDLTDVEMLDEILTYLLSKSKQPPSNPVSPPSNLEESTRPPEEQLSNEPPTRKRPNKPKTPSRKRVHSSPCTASDVKKRKVNQILDQPQ